MPSVAPAITAKRPLGAMRGMQPISPARASGRWPAGVMVKAPTPFWLLLPRVRATNQLSSGAMAASFTSAKPPNRSRVASTVAWR